MFVSWVKFSLYQFRCHHGIFSSLSDLKSTSVNNKPRTIFRAWEVYISVVLLCNPGSLGRFFDAFLSAKPKWMRHIQFGRVLIWDIHFCERGNGPHFELFWIPFFEFHEVCWIRFGCWESFVGFHIRYSTIFMCLAFLFTVGVRILWTSSCWIEKGAISGNLPCVFIVWRDNFI